LVILVVLVVPPGERITWIVAAGELPALALVPLRRISDDVIRVAVEEQETIAIYLTVPPASERLLAQVVR
jgi:hypothetical protein